MWTLCRSFHLPKLGLEANFVSAVAYFNIPPEAEDGTAAGAELFMVGCDNGTVALIDIPPPDTAELQSAERLVDRVPDAMERVCHPLHRHASDVLAVASLGLLGASASNDGTCCVFAVHPLPGRRVATLGHPAAVRCVTLWEGRPEWAACSAEEAAVYVVTGCHDGFVRVWRVDVATGVAFVHSVFCMSVVGAQGDAAVVAAAGVENTRGGPARRTLALPVYCVALDGDERLLFGNERGKWAAVRLDGLRRRCTSVLDADADADAGGGGDASLMSAVTDEGVLGALVWVAAADELERALRSGGAAAQHMCTSVKARHREAVCGGLAVGTVTDHLASWGPRPHERVVTAAFPQLKKTARWPLAAVRRVGLADLVASGHDEGPVFALCVLRAGRFASGGADGVVRIWEFDDPSGRYELRHSLAEHTDLVRSLHLVRSPDIFLSTSHDGVCREWHVYDEPAAVICQAALYVGVHDNLYRKVEMQRMAVAAADVFAPARCMFLVGLFEAIIRVYAMFPVATCELPPGWFYNGFNSVKVVDADLEAQRARVEAESAHTRQQNFDTFVGLLDEQRKQQQQQQQRGICQEISSAPSSTSSLESE